MSDLGVENRDHGFDSEGGQRVHLDASRREVVQLCGEKGTALFTFLLSSSMLMLGREDLAVFSLQRLSDVALQLGWSPDTVKRYVAVFRAMNLVQHSHDHRREVKLHIPLGPYTPLTNFTALDELMGKRKKQQQLARSVKTRYIMRFGDPTQAHSDEIRARLAELKAILDNEHLEPLKRQRLQIKIADWLVHFAGKAENSRVGDPNDVLDRPEAAKAGRRPSTARDAGDSQEALSSVKTSSQGDLEGREGDPLRQRSISLGPEPQGDPNDVQGDLCSAKTSNQGDLERQEGDPLRQRSISLGPEPQGDPNSRQGDLTSYHTIDRGGSSSTQEVPQGDPNQKLGDALLPSHAQHPLETNPLGDSDSHIVQRSGDLYQDDNLLTYNVHALISNIPKDNAQRQRVAQFLGKVLEDDANTFKKYLKLFTQYRPEVIGRAFLCTMVLIHREHWSIHRPGGFFTAQCWALSGKCDLKGYTLADVEQWLSAFGNLPYGDLMRALTAPPTTKPSPASLITASPQGSPSSVKGWPGHVGESNTTAKKKRTYGMHFTGLPSGRKGFNTTGSLTPPSSLGEDPLKSGSNDKRNA